MDDSEDEELEALRRERQERLGHAGVGPRERIGTHFGPDEVAVRAGSKGQEIREMLPTSFGSRKGSVSDDRILKESTGTLLSRERQPAPAADEFIGPSLPVQTEAGSGDELEQGTRWNLPISSEVTLDPHTKGVLSLDVDPSGGRLITGSADYTVKVFDFAGMKSDCKPFKSFEPCEGHPVLGLSWSPTGDAFLVVTGSAQPKIYTRDGVEQGEFPRGDMYIRDLKNTKGHITSCTDGQWHPTDKGSVATSSADGTIRVWNVVNMSQDTVIKPLSKTPGRIPVTSLRYSCDGTLVAGGLENGTIHLWDIRGRVGRKASTGMVAASKFQSLAKQNWSFLTRAGRVIHRTHEEGSDITCIRMSRNGFSLLSRGSDKTLKLWDLRKFQSPLATVADLETGFGNTQCCFSPDEQLVLTGVAATQNADGYVAIFDSTDLSPVKRLGAPGSVVPILWHHKLNQIIFGCGDRKQGDARILYDVNLSTRGALLAIGKKPKKPNASDFEANIRTEIYNPNALPMYREDFMNKKRPASSAASKMAKLFKPDQGTSSVGKGAEGRLGTSTGSLLTQYLMKNSGTLKNPADEDVRASILRHAEKESEFARFTDAYTQTQPTRIFATEEDDGKTEDNES